MVHRYSFSRSTCSMTAHNFKNQKEHCQQYNHKPKLSRWVFYHLRWSKADKGLLFCQCTLMWREPNVYIFKGSAGSPVIEDSNLFQAITSLNFLTLKATIISATRVIESSGDILLGAKQCEVREHVPRSEFRGFPCTLLLQKFSSNIPGLWNPGPPRRAYFPPHRCTSSNHREQVNEIMLLAFSRDSSRPGRKTTIWQIWQSSPNAVD